MANAPPPKRMKGMARVTFIAHRAEIEAELDAGWPIKAIYQRRANKLGMSYQQFARYVGSIIRGDRHPGAPAPALESRPAAVAPQQSGKSKPPSSDVKKEPSLARHEPATFTFDGQPRADDEARLIGGAARKPKE